MIDTLFWQQLWLNAHLLRPWWLLALGLPLLLLYWHWRQHHTGQNFIRQSILRYLRGQQQNENQRPIALWLLLPWVLGVLALSGPAHRQADALYQRSLSAIG